LHTYEIIASVSLINKYTYISYILKRAILECKTEYLIFIIFSQ